MCLFYLKMSSSTLQDSAVSSPARMNVVQERYQLGRTIRRSVHMVFMPSNYRAQHSPVNKNSFIVEVLYFKNYFSYTFGLDSNIFTIVKQKVSLNLEREEI